MANIDMKDTDMDVLPLVARVPLVVLFLAVGLEPSWVIGLPGSIRQQLSMLSGDLVRICKATGTLVVTVGFRIGIVGLLLAAVGLVAAIAVHLPMPLDVTTNLKLAGGLLLLVTYAVSSLMVRRIKLQSAAIKIQSNHENRSITR